ncbi:MAG: FAD-binding protein [Coriobacteriia bacterium]|jgi:flavin-dependent dehydrogenase|nr:FAD-binding protein [Coriobacteriia bacterium]
MYDVCIIGAGPAGSAVARLMRPGLRVLLVDKRRLDREPQDSQSPVKLCGGLLAPSAQRELARQRLALPARVISAPQLFAVRAVDRDLSIERHYQRFYINTDREAFDRWLLEFVPREVDTAFGFSAYRIDTSEVVPQVWLRSTSGSSASVCAKVIIGADGANSMVRRTLCPRLAEPGYVALQGLFSRGSDEGSYGAFFDEHVTDFYGWSIPKGPRVALGVAVGRGRDARAAFHAVKSQARELGIIEGDRLALESAPLRRPRSMRDVVLGDDRLICVGEAAGLISASSAEGISYALRSGAALASALQHGIDGASSRYRSLVAPVVADTLLKVAKARVLYSTPLRRAIMRSGITAIGEAHRAPAGGLHPLLGRGGDSLVDLAP